MQASSKSTNYDCIKALQSYILGILRPRDKSKEITGMKCLLLDKETMSIISSVCAMHDILSKEVFLVDLLDGKRESVSHMKAIVLIRPTNENIRELAKQIYYEEPLFSEYNIFFTNFVSPEMLQDLARADRYSLVKQVQEFYVDYNAINTDLYSIHLPNSLSMSEGRKFSGGITDVPYQRSIEALLSLFLSFRIKPYIRFQKCSPAAEALARGLYGAIEQERVLFSFNRQAVGFPLVLIMDRREDPFAPLLTPWTYQSMIHEHIPRGLRGGRVDLRSTEGLKADSNIGEAVLSYTEDQLYRENIHNDFGTVNQVIDSFIKETTRKKEELQAKTSNTAAAEHFADALSDLHHINEQSLLASKHFAILHILEREVSRNKLLDISPLEQNIVTDGSATEAFRSIQTHFADPSPPENKLTLVRLVALFFLRHEKKYPELCSRLRQMLVEKPGYAPYTVVLDSILAYAGQDKRRMDPNWKSDSIFSKGFRRANNNLAAYMRYETVMEHVLEQLARGKLGKDTFEYASMEMPAGKISNVIVFYIGGATYDEAHKVHLINTGKHPICSISGDGTSSKGSATPPFNIIIGGTTMHNTKTFIKEVVELAGQRMPDDKPAIEVVVHDSSGTGFRSQYSSNANSFY